MTTLSTAESAPVIAGMRLRAGRAGSGKGAGRMITAAISTARAAGARGPLLVRGDSAYGSRAVVGACVRHDAQFSLVMTRNTAVGRAIAAISEDAWTPVSYPGAVRDPDTGAWISDAEVAEISYTAFAGTPEAITAAWSYGGSKTPTTSTHYFRYGDITRFSPPSSRISSLPKPGCSVLNTVRYARAGVPCLTGDSRNRRINPPKRCVARRDPGSRRLR